MVSSRAESARAYSSLLMIHLGKLEWLEAGRVWLSFRKEKNIYISKEQIWKVQMSDVNHLEFSLLCNFYDNWVFCANCDCTSRAIYEHVGWFVIEMVSNFLKMALTSDQIVHTWSVASNERHTLPKLNYHDPTNIKEMNLQILNFLRNIFASLQHNFTIGYLMPKDKTSIYIHDACLNYCGTFECSNMCFRSMIFLL